MKLSYLGAALISLCLLQAPHAQAACARFTASDINVTYDPLGTQGVTQVVQPISLGVSRDLTVSGATPQSVTAQFVDSDSGNTLRIGTSGPIYSIESASSVAVSRITAPLDPAHSFTYPFSQSGTGLTETIRGIQFFIDPGQDIPAGVYSENLDVQYRCNVTGETDFTDLQSAALRVSVSVPSKLTASLAGVSASGTLQFDDFSSLAQTAMVNVYSTGPFSFSAVSDNGAMKLQGAPVGAANAQIAYSLGFDGQAISSGDVTHHARTGIGGASLPLTVTAEPIQGKRAGIYHDNLTLTFTPLATL
jgi:hypothetical protein